jgi:hypothetical protein
VHLLVAALDLFEGVALSWPCHQHTLGSGIMGQACGSPRRRTRMRVPRTLTQQHRSLWLLPQRFWHRCMSDVKHHITALFSCCVHGCNQPP